MQLELQHFHDRATVTASVALKQSPAIHVSATVGTPSIALGAESSYDMKSSTLTSYTAGVSAKKSDACASIIL